MPLKDGSFGTEYSLAELRLTAARAPMDSYHRGLMEINAKLGRIITLLEWHTGQNR